MAGGKEKRRKKDEEGEGEGEIMPQLKGRFGE